MELALPTDKALPAKPVGNLAGQAGEALSAGACQILFLDAPNAIARASDTRQPSVFIRLDRDRYSEPGRQTNSGHRLPLPANLMWRLFCRYKSESNATGVISGIEIDLSRLAMANLAELKSDLEAKLPRHNYTVRCGHEYTFVPDIPRRLAALDTVKQSVTSHWSRDVKPFVVLLTEHIRRARRPNTGDVAETSQLHKAFSLQRLEDDFGRRSRARSVLHRLRSERLFRYALPEPDLRYALDILLSLNLSARQDFTKGDTAFPGLRAAELSLANMRHASLSGFNISQARMIGADLYKADLSGANFVAGRLAAAELGYANLRNANLHGVYFTLGALRNAVLDGARLSNATLDYAYLGEASLINADFTDRQREGNIFSAGRVQR